jgi:hypothetical protein
VAPTFRHAATPNPDLSRYVERLEREVEQAKDERDFLHEQIDRKDKTIDGLIERSRNECSCQGIAGDVGPIVGAEKPKDGQNSY